MTPDKPPRVAALVLAAGGSVRMAPHHKLLLRDASGVGMAARVVAACSASRAAWVIVVTGHQAAAVERDIARASVRGDLRFVHAPDWHTGLSASLRAGVQALPDQADAALVCLGDMPGVDAALMDRLIAAYAPAARRCVVAPVWQGRRGNPVLWDRRFFAALSALSGDTGGRALLTAHEAVLAGVPANGPGVLADCDTPEQARAAGFGAGISA